MDLRVLLTTFGIIFLAEMGDKTQLAAMTMAADTKKPWAVFSAPAWRSRRFRRWEFWWEVLSVITCRSSG